MIMAFLGGGRGVCYKTALVNKFFFQAANRVSHISGICYPFEISAASHLHTKLSLVLYKLYKIHICFNSVF